MRTTNRNINHYKAQAQTFVAMALTGLQGLTQGTIECEFFHNSEEVLTILNKGIAATSAGDNGAINVWEDDDGNIRCEAQKFMVTMDSQIFDCEKMEGLDQLTEWLDKWLFIINNRA